MMPMFGCAVPFPHQAKIIAGTYVLAVKLHIIAFSNHGNFCLGTRENLFHRTSKEALIDAHSKLEFTWVPTLYVRLFLKRWNSHEFY